MTGASSADSSIPRRHVSVLYVVMVAVAMVVGAGIFRSPAVIAENAGSATAFFAAWIAGGLISLAGALCFAELATMLPSAGGDYHFLKTTYGRGVAFLFAWARFAVINTGSLALLGFVLGDYANAIWSLGPHGSSWYASITIVAMTLFNLKGLYTGQSAVFWLFLTLSGFAVVLLRVSRPDLPRPFRVPWFPFLPLVFCASCLFVLWSSVAYVRLGALAGVAMLFLGGIVLLWVRRAPRTAQKNAEM